MSKIFKKIWSSLENFVKFWRVKKLLAHSEGIKTFKENVGKWGKIFVYLKILTCLYLHLEEFKYSNRDFMETWGIFFLIRRFRGSSSIYC